MVVVLAVVPDKLDVVQSLLHESVLLRAQFFVGCAEVHWIFDDEGIVGEPERFLKKGLLFQSTGVWNS
jgi:hypothetical protein